MTIAFRCCVLATATALAFSLAAHAEPAETWYAPVENDFRPAYRDDLANQKKQSWDEHWKWVKTFYDGGFLVQGWTAKSNGLLDKIGKAETRNKLRGELNELGRKIASEWSKDNSVRKIDTQNLQALGNRLLAAKKRDDGSGAELGKAVEAIRADVAKRLR